MIIVTPITANVKPGHCKTPGSSSTRKIPIKAKPTVTVPAKATGTVGDYLGP
jgi:hypothetical protein